MQPRHVAIVVALVSGASLVTTAGSAALATVDTSASGAASSQRIVFFATRGAGVQLYTVAPDGSGRRALTRRVVAPSGDQSVDVAPEWSPGHRKIAFASNRWSRSGLDEDVFVVAANGRGLRRLAATRAAESSPSWSPDAKQIVFARAVGRGSDLFVVRVDTGAVRRLTQTKATEAVPAWSPDGSSIAYVRDGDLWAMRSDGKQARRLVDTLGVSWAPDWSPDSTSIAFQTPRNPENGTTDIWMVRRDGSGVRPLTRNWINETSPAWSRNGTSIAFCREGVIWTMRADGSRQRRVTVGSGPDW
jgi:Tol biopolymer transport system component